MKRDANEVKDPRVEFMREYEALCKLHGLELVAVPALVQTNHGTFEIGMRYSVQELAKSQ